jgi:hypothetical protein
MCTNFDYSPAKEVVGMLWFFLTALFCLYFAIQYEQTNILADSKDTPHIGEVWRNVRFYGGLGKGMCFWAFYANFFFGPEHGWKHLIGYTLTVIALTWLEVEIVLFHLALEKDRAGGLPFQEYLGPWAKPLMICYLVALIAQNVIRQSIFWGQIVFNNYFYDPDNQNAVTAMRVADLFGFVVGGIMPIFIAINLRKKSAPLSSSVWLDQKAKFRRFSVNHKFGYSEEEWALAIAQQRKGNTM